MARKIKRKPKKNNIRVSGNGAEELNTEELEREAGYTGDKPESGQKVPSKKNGGSSKARSRTAAKTRGPRRKRHRIKNVWLRIFVGLIVAVISVCFVVGVCGAGLAMSWMSEAPKLDPGKFEFVNATAVLDINDNFYQELQTSEMRDPVSIGKVPELVQMAFVSIEDQRFYSHFGVDVRGTLKAIIQVLLTRSTSGSGGSTITQQLIKLTHLTSETSIKRKVMEWKLAYELERTATKRQILEIYLNKINLSYAWGIESASQMYFGLHCDELSVAQASVLASIMKAPSYYSPYVYETDEEGNSRLARTTDEAGNTVIVLSEHNRDRAKLVVDKMYELGHISRGERDIAFAALDNNTVGLIVPKFTTEYTYFTDAVYSQVLNDLMERYGLSQSDAANLLLNGGLVIHSTVDPLIQKAMEDQAADDARFPAQSSTAKSAEAAMSEATGEEASFKPEVGGVVIENRTGYVCGIIGGRQKVGNLTMNRGLQKFQTGSSTKPLTCYSPAFEEKVVTPATMFADVPLSFGGWKPGDAGSCQGLISVRQGLSSSVNIVAVQVENALGFEKGAEYGERYGLDIVWEGGSDINAAALALGGYTYGQTPLAMADAYTTFPNGGYRITPTFYRYVTDSEGNVLLEATQDTVQVISEATAWLTTDILKSVVKGGTTTISVAGQEIAGKTGTTDKRVCAWFCGFTADYSGAFWFGYDAQKLTINKHTYDLRIGVTGGGGANSPAHFWQAVFNQFYKDKKLPSKSLPKMPGSGVFSATIDGASGKIPGELSELDPRGSKVHSEYFLDGTYPSDVDDVHVEVDVCTETGLLATAGCPSERKVMLYIDPEEWMVYGGKEYKEYTIKGYSEYLVPTATCTAHTAASTVSELYFGLTADINEERISSGSAIAMRTGQPLHVYVRELFGNGSCENLSGDLAVSCSDESNFSVTYKKGKITVSSLNHMQPTTATVTVSKSYNIGTAFEYTVTSNFTVNCTAGQYTITSNAWDENHQKGGGTITASGTYSEGTNVKYYMAPDDEHELSDVLVDGVSVGAVGEYEFTNLSGDHVIEAFFVRKGTEPEEPGNP
ncbi:MAG: transglycosylase domain-containing protein [Eubacteriaceae bacterium]|nr:transglycosylase domain-containing protein [Eubacteriaceae bacterium]